MFVCTIGIFYRFFVKMCISPESGTEYLYIDKVAGSCRKSMING